MRIRVAVSFNGMVAGDTATVGGNDTHVQAYIGAGLFEVIDHGEREAGPGIAAPVDSWGVDERATGGGPAGGEPGEDLVSG